MLRSAKFLLGSVILLVLCADATRAVAQPQVVCSTHDEIVNLLKVTFAETPVSAALTDNGQMLEVFASDKGSWTMVITVPGGPSCMMATGQNWQTFSTLKVNLPVTKTSPKKHPAL